MVSIGSINNDKLREELNQRGFNIGPITPSTRRVYEKKLVNLLKADGSDAYFIEDDTLDQSNASQNGLSRRSSSPEVQIVFQSPTELNGNESHVQEKTPATESSIASKTKGKKAERLNASRIETPSVPVVGQRASEDESNEGSEGSRVLTPEEVRDFRSRMSIGKSNGRANGAIKKSAKASNQYLFTCITLIVLALAVFAAYMMMNNSLKDQLLSKVSELTQAVKAMYDRYQLPQKKSVEDSVGSL